MCVLDCTRDRKNTSFCSADWTTCDLPRLLLFIGSTYLIEILAFEINISYRHPLTAIVSHYSKGISHQRNIGVYSAKSGLALDPKSGPRRFSQCSCRPRVFWFGNEHRHTPGRKSREVSIVGAQSCELENNWGREVLFQRTVEWFLCGILHHQPLSRSQLSMEEPWLTAPSGILAWAWPHRPAARYLDLCCSSSSN